MKPATLLPLATAAAAFVVPDASVFAQLELSAHHESSSSWADWLTLPSTDAVHSVKASVHSAIDALSAGIENAVHDVKERLDGDMFLSDDAASLASAMARPGPNRTIYQLITESKYTTRLAALVNEYDDIVQLLNGTAANYTLFAPIDAAFEHIPDDKKPPREFVENVLKYHVGLGLYPAGRVLVTHTLPSALDEPWLGNKPQRLRTSVGVLSGVRVNFYSKVVAVDIFATNGVVHAVKSLLVPPPMVGRELAIFPSKFSTLLLAYNKTDFVSFIHSQKMIGSTVFAPDNAAFAKLGPAANAFLFNTEKGLAYLKAILKYHIIANETVYSDAYYSSTDKGAERDGGEYHLQLPTLLDDQPLTIDVKRFAGFINVRVNGYIPITVQDGIAKNGVIHVPGNVIIPPRRHGKENSEDVGAEISVEELMERLADYVEEPRGGKEKLQEVEL